MTNSPLPTKGLRVRDLKELVNKSIVIEQQQKRIIYLNHEAFVKQFYPFFEHIYDYTVQYNTSSEAQTSLIDERQEVVNELISYLESVEVHDFVFETFYNQLVLETEGKHAMIGLIFVLAQLTNLKSAFGKLFELFLELGLKEFCRKNGCELANILSKIKSIGSAQSPTLVEILEPFTETRKKSYVEKLSTEGIVIIELNDDSDEEVSAVNVGANVIEPVMDSGPDVIIIE